MAITTGIVGAAGFAGIELIRLALRHPDLDLRVVTSNELAGTPVVAEYPGFTGATDLAFTAHDDPALDACDLVFLAVPHTAALAMAPRLVARGATVVDLSADFRLKDPAVYERWYATPHTATDLLQRAAFGLPELFPDDLARAAGARAAGEGVLVACAGCYHTATSLAAAPAVRAGLVRPNGVVVVDAISGVTGAGKKASTRTHFCFADENLEAYGVATHRHTPEIEQILGLEGRLVFTPHLAPLNRGLLSTVNLPLASDAPVDAGEIVSCTGTSARTTPSCTCWMPAPCRRPRRWRARTTRTWESPSTRRRACWWPWALSTTWARARPARPCSARTPCWACPRLEGSNRSPYPCDANRPSKLQPHQPQQKEAAMTDQPIAATHPAQGGVTAARGFRASGVHAGFRKDPERLDLALVVADEPCACAAVFTKNVFCSAPVIVSRAQLGADQPGEPAYGTARAVVVNSGNANAATGEPGLEAARETARIAGDAVGCPASEVLVASTGVIGVQLPLAPFGIGLPAAASLLSAGGGADAARAIMTTDTRPKEAAVTFSGDGIGYDGCTFTVGGMSKGSGMIMPNMATMIAVLTTDAPVSAPALHRALVHAVNRSFNKVTVDSDTSTNDSCFLFASGAAAPAGASAFDPDGPAFARFQAALVEVCETLARMMAADGEGATRLVTVHVTGAANDTDADLAARAVANSPLVKTAVCGRDANWGRIAAAIGKSGAVFRQEDASIDIMGLPVCRGGLAQAFDEDEALRRFEQPEIVIDVDLGAGEARTTVWTCDFTHEYITINGDYRS